MHISENCHRLKISTHILYDVVELYKLAEGFNDVCFLRLPTIKTLEQKTFLTNAGDIVANLSKQLTTQATVIIFGDITDLVHIHSTVSSFLRYQLLIAIKCKRSNLFTTRTNLAHEHLGALIYTKYNKTLQHTKTRLAYTHCPVCNKTTKDYGGKKHTFNSYGTLISDVWRDDLLVDLAIDINPVLERFADLFGLEGYQELRNYDLSHVLTERTAITLPIFKPEVEVSFLESKLLNGDCLSQLRTLPDNSVDFAFADPPYNLKKDYKGYSDDLAIKDYFEWCNSWIVEIARVLRNGRTFALLNIPLWSITLFFQLEKVLNYQNWIVWDALSFPVRMIMPAHYTILCFTKGKSRPLPGLVQNTSLSERHKILTPLAEGFCLRKQCVTTRETQGIYDRGILSDVWSDIHRLKHNTRRVDHPCQLPPQLMYRLITIFTNPGELILDCFNGAGTTTLSAHQLKRKYVGIELEQSYYNMSVERHKAIDQGLDPFSKKNRKLTVKNSPVVRCTKKQKYEIPKKELQLDVKRIAQVLGHIPNRDEVIAYGKYPIIYYDNYFTSWGEVCAAARTNTFENIS